MGEIQGLVDALADRLGRPVGVDDRAFRVIAYSSHVDEVDPVRLASILQREAPHDVTDWLESLGIRDVDGYLRVPENTRFGMAARVCIPIRFDGVLLGYLWLIDRPAAVTADELATAARVATDLGNALFRVQRLEHEDRKRERDLLRAALVDGEPAAAEELVRAGFLVSGDQFGVVMLTASHPEGRTAPDAIRVRLASSAEHVRRRAAPRRVLCLVNETRITVLVAADAATLPSDMAAELTRSARDRLGDGPWTVHAGASDVFGDPADTGSAVHQADVALSVARALQRSGGSAGWADLGSYRTVGMLVRHAAGPQIPAPVERLCASGDADTLIRTAEAYLDAGCDARATADVLFVHRSSLYSRLRRIEALAGMSFRSGDDRLELHLGLRLWRLTQTTENTT